MTAAVPARDIAALPRLGYPEATAAFARTYGLLGLLFVTGVGVDLWAHNNIRPLFETFFTPWHGLLYGGFGLFAGFLILSAGRHHAAGYAMTRSLPRGYGLSLIGVAIFSAGGLFDLIWHGLFGIEADFDALISPSHLILVTGGTLMASAALRAASSSPLLSRWPAVLSALATVIVLLPFFDFFIGPFSTRTATGSASRDALEAAQVLATLTYTAIVVGVLVYLLRPADHLPHGAGLLVVTGSAAAMALIRARDLGPEREVFLGVALVAGLLTELLLVALRPSRSAPRAIRAFAAALPVAILVPYFAAIALTLPVAWSVHAVVGTVALATATGGLLGILATPSSAAHGL